MTSLNMADYDYTLPSERIAQYPLSDRAHSKLLVCRNHVIEDAFFYNLYKFIKPQTLFFFNNTKVMKARLLFFKETGAAIEIFCLNPVLPASEMSLAMSETGGTVWECLVGNARKWKEGVLKKTVSHNGATVTLKAEKHQSLNRNYHIAFSWDNKNLPFADILEIFGQTPLPPYLNRQTEAVDDERYQTIYAEQHGSVAAPTAGLHFTPEVLSDIRKYHPDSRFAYLNLNVSAGTFRPVKGDIAKHDMHKEHFSIKTSAIADLYRHIDKGTVLAVGTTSARTLESLYWIGVNMINKKQYTHQVAQFQDINHPSNISAKNALEVILEHQGKNGLEELHAFTSIMFVPGYKFRLVNHLLTNFHQPRSTLVLLVAAFIGKRWKKVYEHAMDNGYRFLSYGDACLFEVAQSMR